MTIGLDAARQTLTAVEVIYVSQHSFAHNAVLMYHEWLKSEGYDVPAERPDIATLLMADYFDALETFREAIAEATRAAVRELEAPSNDTLN